MKDINTIPIEELGGYSYACECGTKHTIETADIIFRENALSQLSAVVEKLAGRGSKILTIYSEGSAYLKEAIEDNLDSFEVISEVLNVKLPEAQSIKNFCGLAEDVRLIVAVGGGALCDTVKYIATSLKRRYILIPDIIRCDAFLSPSAVVYQSGFKEVFKINPPDAIIVDYTIVLNMEESDIAAAFGNIVGKYISLFDWKVANVINGEKYCKTIAELSATVIDECLKAAEGARRQERPALLKLIELNLRAGLYMQLSGGSRFSCGGETHVEHVLEMLFIRESRELKAYGENIMLCAAFLVKVYKIALEREFGSLLFPPDNNMRADCITEYLGVDGSKSILRVRPLLDENTLRARRHKLREYKEEFFEEITKIDRDITVAYKLFRRIYEDAGYSLINYVDSADFKIALPLAPDIREKFTLLTMLKDMGLLDDYLPVKVG